MYFIQYCHLCSLLIREFDRISAVQILGDSWCHEECYVDFLIQTDESGETGLTNEESYYYD